MLPTDMELCKEDWQGGGREWACEGVWGERRWASLFLNLERKEIVVRTRPYCVSASEETETREEGKSDRRRFT